MKEIKGFEGKYLIDEQGNIYSNLKNRYLSINKKVYATVSLVNSHGLQRQFSVHRLLYETYVGEIPQGYQIDHIDGNKLNNSLENLEAVTPKENSRRAVNNKLRDYSDISGDNNKLTRLTDSDFLEGLSRLIIESDL